MGTIGSDIQSQFPVTMGHGSLFPNSPHPWGCLGTRQYGIAPQSFSSAEPQVSDIQSRNSHALPWYMWMPTKLTFNLQEYSCKKTHNSKMCKTIQLKPLSTASKESEGNTKKICFLKTMVFCFPTFHEHSSTGDSATMCSHWSWMSKCPLHVSKIQMRILCRSLKAFKKM